MREDTVIVQYMSFLLFCYLWNDQTNMLSLIFLDLTPTRPTPYDASALTGLSMHINESATTIA